MGVERRRAGFRLPWAGEAEDAEGEQAEADVEVEAMTPANGSALPAPENAAEGTAAEGMAADASVAFSALEGAANESGSEPMSGDSESAGFLADLVGAMRGVAETSRDASLGELRTAIEARIDELGAQGTEQEAELRRRADVDVESIGEWERNETERIRSEADAKRNSRRRELEQQLSERHTATERQIEATRSRMAEHEQDLAAFFAQLGEITDPAAFVAAAKRMPRAPDLDDVIANPTTQAAVATYDPRLAALEMPSVTPAEPEPEPAADAAETVAESAATDAAPSDQPTAAPAETGETATTSETAEAPVAQAAADAHLAERLAQLDQRLSGTTQPVAATPPTSPATNGGEQSTAIVVKGLGSFGAITSFKQALERVEGVRGVTLSLGPTGEFVYRASHASDFDINAAIQSIEGPTASIEETDGTLVVTLSRTR
jgi:hypothetical protein